MIVSGSDYGIEVEVRLRCLVCGRDAWVRQLARSIYVTPGGGRLEAVTPYYDQIVCGCGKRDGGCRDDEPVRVTATILLEGPGIA